MISRFRQPPLCVEAAGVHALAGPAKADGEPLDEIPTGWTGDIGFPDFGIVCAHVDGTPVCHTVGLYERFGQPELLVVGLAAAPACALLARHVRQIIRGESLPNGYVADAMHAGRHVWIGVLREPVARRVAAAAVLDDGTFPVIQQIVPRDAAGQFPWMARRAGPTPAATVYALRPRLH